MIVMVHETPERRILHDFFDQQHPELGHISLVCPGLLNSNHHAVILKECYICDKKRVHLSTYEDGLLENNKDESYRGLCKCGHYCRWEPNYDSLDSVKYVSQRNVMLIGNALARFSHKKWDVSKTKKIQHPEFERFIVIKLTDNDLQELASIKKKDLPSFVKKFMPQTWFEKKE